MRHNSMDDVLPQPSAATGHDNTAALWNKCPPARQVGQHVLTVLRK